MVGEKKVAKKGGRKGKCLSAFTKGWGAAARLPPHESREVVWLGWRAEGRGYKLENQLGQGEGGRIGDFFKEIEPHWVIILFLRRTSLLGEKRGWMGREETEKGSGILEGKEMGFRE